MKVRSKKLYLFLQEAGVLSGTPEEIASAKLRYRKLYQRQWAKTRLRKKEVRPAFTPKEYMSLKIAAAQAGMTVTEYIRQAALERIGQPLISQKDMLLEVLQCISMTLCRIPDADLSRAETLLLKYLSHDS